MASRAPHVNNAGSVFVGTLSALFLLGCGGSKEPGSPTGQQLRAGEIMRRVEDAVRKQGEYRIVVQGHNLVLPEWGGVDGGQVLIRLEDGAVEASLARTGDAGYAMVRFDNETFFQRSTCSYFQRVPDGGAEVLRPFVLTEWRVLTAGGVSPSRDGPAVITISGQFPDLGRATLTVDAFTYLPQTLVKPRDDSGSETTWAFDMWGTKADIRAAPPSFGDQGPGGDPC